MNGATTLQERPGSAERPSPTFLDIEAPDANAITNTRHELRALLNKASVHPHVADAAELVFSELATNALEHGQSGARIGIAATTTATTIAIAVTDMPRPGNRPSYADPEQHGRGMLLAQALATITHTQGPGWHTVTAVIQIGETR